MFRLRLKTIRFVIVNKLTFIDFLNVYNKKSKKQQRIGIKCILGIIISVFYVEQDLKMIQLVLYRQSPPK